MPQPEIRKALLALVAQLPATNATPVYLDAKLRTRFLLWSAREQHNTRRWVRDQERYLEEWGSELSGVDLRTIGIVRHVLPVLDRHPSAAPQRIATLKRLVSWLCNVRHELDIDPLSTLKVPQSTPEQWRRSKVVERKVIGRTRARLSHTYQDALDVLLGTGWHLTELDRFARSGTIVPATPGEVRTGVAGVLETRHKSGRPHRTAVSSRALAAAMRLRERGAISVATFCKAVRRAARRARVEPWSPGRLRHTIATHAMQEGADPSAVSAFLGHQDARTTRRFYAVYVAPKKIPTLC